MQQLARGNAQHLSKWYHQYTCPTKEKLVASKQVPWFIMTRYNQGTSVSLLTLLQVKLKSLTTTSQLQNSKGPALLLLRRYKDKDPNGFFYSGLL